MQPKLIKTEVSRYVPAQWDGENRSGIVPIGEKVLILTDQVGDVTRGGVHLPSDMRERADLAAETGVIVALGDGAFVWNEDKTRPWSGYKPKVGDHVYIQRYAGAVFPGDDGQKYRVVDYNQIGAVREAPLTGTVDFEWRRLEDEPYPKDILVEVRKGGDNPHWKGPGILAASACGYEDIWWRPAKGGSND